MSLLVVSTAEAEADFDKAADWHERQAGLGAKFTLRVRQALARTGRMPELHAVLHRSRLGCKSRFVFSPSYAACRVALVL